MYCSNIIKSVIKQIQDENISVHGHYPNERSMDNDTKSYSSTSYKTFLQQQRRDSSSGYSTGQESLRSKKEETLSSETLNKKSFQKATCFLQG